MPMYGATFTRPVLPTENNVVEVSVLIRAQNDTEAGHIIAVLQAHCLRWPGLELESWTGIPPAEDFYMPPDPNQAPLFDHVTDPWYFQRHEAGDVATG